MSYEKTKAEVLRLIGRSNSESKSKNDELCWALLSEAHIISQPFALLHSIVHWQMLVLALKQRNLTEISGQIIRLIVAAPGSLLGKYPLGNTGRSHVNMFQPQEISPELKEKMKNLAEE